MARLAGRLRCFLRECVKYRRGSRYIQNQEEHHRKQSFEDEYLSLLERSGAPFDRDHIFD